MQQKTDSLACEATKIELQIYLTTTETMAWTMKEQKYIILGGKELNDVDSFTYLTSVVSATGGSDGDIKACKNQLFLQHCKASIKSSFPL
ncbi:hypothetical protein DPMN_174310 [Dreissena polymorpha]|uniref:Uncharacterized protein n=1 Tax=Dreissena polymorpha TaxID=45954 RepID=A0A9D4E363_DREPO|nr:hypothetical protein DPMN_174310 [Dreissena polymorpha]